MSPKEAYLQKMLINKLYIEKATTGELFQLDALIQHEITLRKRREQNKKGVSEY